MRASVQNNSTVFRYAAAYYLDWWLMVDKEIVETFRNQTVNSGILHKLFTKYRVSRTIRGTGPARLDFIAEIFNKDLRKSLSKEEIIDFVKGATSMVAEHYMGKLSSTGSEESKRPLSAVSKASWIKWQHPVAILDSLSRRGLMSFGFTVPQGDYAAYYQAWIDFFESEATQKELTTACSWLRGSHYAQRLIYHQAATQKSIDEWVMAEWFQNRIVDQRLVIRGQLKDVIPLPRLAMFIGPG